jgi:hypothetical protein
MMMGIAIGAIRAEIMRVFMRMILPAGATASNEKARRSKVRAFCACQEVEVS